MADPTPDEAAKAAADAEAAEAAKAAEAAAASSDTDAVTAPATEQGEPQSPGAADALAQSTRAMPTGPVSETGLWVDLANGAVVESAPERGKQLVAPGGQLTPDVQAGVDRARAAHAAGGGIVPGAETLTTETATASAKRETRKRA